MLFQKKISFKQPPPPSNQSPLPLPPKRTFPRDWFLTACFCGWLIYQSLSSTLPKASEPPRLYSNQCQQNLKLTLLDAIRQARSSIHLVMFGLTDSSILTLLSQKIQKQIPTTIYYDPTGTPQIRHVLNGAEVHPIKNAGLMHQKILILDEEMIFIGSANMTAPSLQMHDNLVVGMVSPPLAQFLQSHAPHQSGHLKTRVGGQEVEIWLLPDPRGHALSDLKRKIRSATHSVRIALFTFTHPCLIEEVIRAHQRGVSVRVVVDRHCGMGASSKAIDRLQKAGVFIALSQGIQLLHHKFVYIDEQTLITGSANWTKAAFTKNNDCFLSLQNLTHEQKRFMNRLWHRIETNSQRKKTTPKLS